MPLLLITGSLFDYISLVSRRQIAGHTAYSPLYNTTLHLILTSALQHDETRVRLSSGRMAYALLYERSHL
jgi:hypothetical protein